MKIAHICLSCFYIDDRAYQENELVEEHKRQGHDVLVMASTHVLDSNGRGMIVSPGSYTNSQGINVVRLAYHPLVPRNLAVKLRIHKGFYQLLDDFSPDVILFHGMCGWELLTATSYRKNNPSIKLYVDTHTDFINSAKNFLSRWVLHTLFYKPIVHLCLPYIEKILCISTLTKKFAGDFYGIPKESLEFYPLGGHPVQHDAYLSIRNSIRKELGLVDGQICFIQSGKQSVEKKLIETLNAFSNNSDPRFRLFIAGSLLDDVRDTARDLIDADSRIVFLGWKKPEELKALLCAADVFLQPGSQSSTMQTSLCCFCVPVLDNIEGHEIYTKNNGWLVSCEKDLELVLEEISSGSADLSAKKNSSEKLAKEMLDYSVLAKRILQ